MKIAIGVLLYIALVLILAPIVGTWVKNRNERR